MSGYKDGPSASGWSPSSWRAMPILQQPKYKDPKALVEALTRVETLPPLVGFQEINNLKSSLAECARGERFLLQGGDCAERFTDCTTETITAKLKILLQMSLVLTYGARTPTVRVGRIAGQYSKPRSSDTEVVDGKTVFSYRGDNVNGFAVADREPDPNRLVDGYFHSAATMNAVRVVLADGLGDVRHAKAWEMGFVKNKTRRATYESMAKDITDSLDFMETCGVPIDPVLQSVDFFTSHEGLHLAYEEAMTSQGPDGRFYNVGTHFLWIGDRTRQLDHAHIEYFRGIANPIGIKVGPSMKPAELVELITRLWPNPAADPGRITLISRFGAEKVATMLPPLLEAVKEAGLPVVWTCDPMHGNTHSTESGMKTRSFDAVVKELVECVKAHGECGTILGGVHFELTGDNVTECVGGPQDLGESDLPERYTTHCDPRLNYAQSIEVAFMLATYLNEAKGNEGFGV